MLIQIDKLKRRPRQIIIDEQATGFPIINDLVDQGVVGFNDTISGSCEAIWAGKVIEVSGSLATTVTSPCCRCLAPVVSQVEIPIALSYAGNIDEKAPLAEEIEIESAEIGLTPYSGPEIDVRADLEQEIIMALPQQPLCQEACQGLCPVCGCNLNQSSCDCQPPVFHAGLAALKSFKVKS